MRGRELRNGGAGREAGATAEAILLVDVGVESGGRGHVEHRPSGRAHGIHPSIIVNATEVIKVTYF